MAGERSIRHGRHGDRIRVPDEYLEYMRRCDRLSADAEGDAPLQAFWLGVKCEYQADLSGQDESATPTRLIALGGGPDIPVGPYPVIVGRDPWCDARLDSIRVSRIHCCLTEDDGKVVVLDLGSANGTRINGRRVELGRLRLGDELSIAHLRYRVEDNRAEWRAPANGEDELPDRCGPPGAPSRTSHPHAGE
jgi:FHA domain